MGPFSRCYGIVHCTSRVACFFELSLLDLFIIIVMHHGQSTPRPYGHSVVTQIPLKRLSDHARRHPNNYSNLYPTMLKLMATQFPQLCLVCEWLTEKKAITGKMVYLQSTNWNISTVGFIDPIMK